MFRIVFADSADLKQIAETLATFRDANWELAQAGLFINTMDNSNCALVDIHIPAKTFDTYEIAHPMVLGIQSERFLSILKVAKHKKVILSSANKKQKKSGGDVDPNPDLVMIEMVDEHTYDNTFILHLLNIEVEQLQVPDGNWAVVASIKPGLFTSIIENQMIISDATRIIVTNQTEPWSMDQTEPEPGEMGPLRMIFVGVSEKGKNMISLTKDQVTFTHGTQTFINLEFSLKFLLQFAKVGLHSSGLELYMSPDTPMVLKYGMRNHTGGFIRFVIAPKIMDEWSAPDTNAVQHEDNSE
jgi:proliferating cell nuclear antigen PCNA